MFDDEELMEEDLFDDEEEERKRGWLDSGPESGTRPREAYHRPTKAERDFEDAMSGKVLNEYLQELAKDGGDEEAPGNEDKYDAIESLIDEQFEGWWMTPEQKSAAEIEDATQSVRDGEAPFSDIVLDSETEDDLELLSDVMVFGESELSDDGFDFEDSTLGEIEFGEIDFGEMDFGELAGWDEGGEEN